MISQENFKSSPLAFKSGSMSVLLIVAIVAAALIRLSLLGKAAFTPAEVELTNSAWQIAQRQPGAGSLAPAYTGLTALLFFLLQPSNFLARLVPALAGISLVALPAFWRDFTGEKRGLVLAIALALDSVFIVFSRAVNPGIIALAALLWALTFLKHKKAGLAGLSLAIGFLSGAAFWVFLLLAGVFYLLFRLFFDAEKVNQLRELIEIKQLASSKAIIAFFAALVLLSTSFLLNPAGLGDAAGGLLEFWRLVGKPFANPVYHPIYLLFARSLLGMLLFIGALIGLKRRGRKELSHFLGAAALVSLLVAIAMSRSSYELLLAPTFLFWIAAAWWLSEFRLDFKLFSFGGAVLAIFMLALMVYFSQNLRKLAALDLHSPQFINIGLMALAGLVLLVSSWWLINHAWPNSSLKRVMSASALLFLIVLNLAGTLRGLKAEQHLRAVEYLGPLVYLPNEDIEQISEEFNLTGKNLGNLGSFGLRELPDQLEWYLRGFAKFRDDNDPSLLLTRGSAAPDVQNDYRGMNIVLERSVDWQKGSLPQYLKTMFGVTPQFLDQKAVLWIKTNLFTGANQ